MGDSVDFCIKRSFLDNSNRTLTISKDFLKFQNKDLKENPFTIFNKEEIAEYSYGIRWISFRLTYGRDYQISVSYTHLDSYKRKLLHTPTYFPYPWK